MRKDVEAECSEYVEVDAPDPGFGAGEPFDEGPAAFVPGATYLVPGDVEDDKEEGADEIYQECRHYSYLISTGRSRSITTTLSFRSVHTHNTGYIQTENSIHGIRTLRTNIPETNLEPVTG